MSLERLASKLEKLLCMKVRELYAKYVDAGKDLYAELLKSTFPECFSQNEG